MQGGGEEELMAWQAGAGLAVAQLPLRVRRLDLSRLSWDAGRPDAAVLCSAAAAVLRSLLRSAAAPCLQHLQLPAAVHHESLLPGLLDQMPRLRSLAVALSGGSAGTAQAYDALPRLPAGLSSLPLSAASQPSFRDDCQVDLALLGARRLPQLRSLDLGHGISLRNAPAICALTGLEELTLQPRFPDMQRLAPELALLSRLSLGSTGVSEAGQWAALAGLPRLRHLELSSLHLEEQQGLALPAAQHVTRLSIHYNLGCTARQGASGQQGGVARLLPGLRELRCWSISTPAALACHAQLRRLHLSRAGGAAWQSLQLSGLAALQEVAVAWVTGEWVADMLAGFAGCPSLQQLVCRGVLPYKGELPRVEEGLRALALGCNRLRRLELAVSEPLSFGADVASLLAAGLPFLHDLVLHIEAPPDGAGPGAAGGGRAAGQLGVAMWWCWGRAAATGRGWPWCHVAAGAWVSRRARR
jgi:hypothetical protein